MSNHIKFQKQLKELIYDINILTNAIEFFKNNFINPSDNIEVKDLVVLINIIHKYSINVQNNSNAINKTQINFFSEYDKLSNTKNS